MKAYITAVLLLHKNIFHSACEWRFPNSLALWRKYIRHLSCTNSCP